jgi:hypothetical protein
MTTQPLWSISSFYSKGPQRLVVLVYCFSTSSIGCSEAGLRRPLQRLLGEGWVVIDRDSVDQRVRRVVAAEKLLGALIQLAGRITDNETQMESA